MTSKVTIFRPKAALFYVHWELSELVFVRPSVKKELFLYWPWYEKQNETEHVYVPWACIYKYIDSENVICLQQDFYTPCFANKIFVSDIRVLQWSFIESVYRYEFILSSVGCLFKLSDNTQYQRVAYYQYALLGLRPEPFAPYRILWKKSRGLPRSCFDKKFQII